jgi:hypothetical protein
MTARRSKFPWSDAQIRRVFARRALPVYTAEELKILLDLAAVGADHILARRTGGRQPRDTVTRGEIRRHLIIESYPRLKAGLRKTPTGVRTIGKLRDILAEEYGFDVSEDTIRKDIMKIGTDSLR